MAYYLKNREKNGIEIYFGSKPEDAVIDDLKLNHWRWFPSKNCWYKKDTPENEQFAKKICSKVTVEEVMSEFQPKTAKTEKPKSIPAPTAKYPTSKSRLDASYFKRDLLLEKKFGIDEVRLYGYEQGEDSICIVGEIIAKKTPPNSFCMFCTLYDDDGDIIETKENRHYGSGLVSSMIKPSSFFNGFPFSFTFWGVKKSKIKEISITPASNY